MAADSLALCSNFAQEVSLRNYDVEWTAGVAQGLDVAACVTAAGRNIVSLSDLSAFIAD